MDRTEIWVIERGGGASFAEEPRFCGSVEAVMGQEELESHHATKSRVVSTIYDAHAAGTECVADLEVRNAAPGETEGIGMTIDRRQESGIDRRELRAGCSVTV